MRRRPLGALRGVIDARREPRIETQSLKARLRQPAAKSIEITVENLSRSGFKAAWPHMANPGDRLWLRLPGLEALAAKVAWTSNWMIGCRFEHPLHPSVLAAVVRLRTALPIVD